MKILAIIAVAVFASALRAEEPNVDSRIAELTKTYERILAEFKGVKDETTAQAARKSLDKLADEREQLMRAIAGLKLKPVDRDAAQRKLDTALGPVSLSMQAEVARVSLNSAALAVLESLAIVREMSALVEARAEASIRNLGFALQTVAIRNDGKYPAKLMEVERYLGDKSNLRDPWGREWQYDVAGKRNDGKKPDVWTVSPFGGGKKVIGNWSGKQ